MNNKGGKQKVGQFSTAYVPVQIDGHHMYALADTGAGVSLISKEALPEGHPVDHQVRIQVSGVTGSELRVLGTTSVELKIGGFVGTALVYVVDTLPNNSFIIGRDILETYNCIVSYKKLTFEIQGHKIPLFKASAVTGKPLVLHCSKSLYMGPYEVGYVNCHLMSKSDVTKRLHLSVTGASEPLLRSRHLVSDPSLVNVLNGKTQLKLINNSCYPITVYRSQKVATFETFNTNEINTLNNAAVNIQVQCIESQLLEHENKPCDADKAGSESFKRWANIDSLYEMLGIAKLEHLSAAEKLVVKSLISEYRDIFAENDDDMECTDMLEQEIVLDTEEPIRAPYYNIPLKLRSHAEKAVKQLMDLNIIQPSTSNYHSPSFLMKKSDGSYRVLTDFRAVNKHVIRSYQPLQGVQEMLSLWHSCKFFSKVDFQKSFYATPLAAKSRHITATSIPGISFFEYLKSPLGLSSSPTFFQSLVEKIFMGLKQSVVCVYLDDAMSGSPTFKGMITNLRLIFERVKASKMLLNTKKVQIFQKELKFLGYIINEKGLATCPEKVASIVKMIPPASTKAVRSFLGMTGFFRKFVLDYAEICEPLTRMTKKNAVFKWTTEAHQAWQTIKDKLVSSPVLVHPDLDKRFTLIIDASSIAAGAILGQKDDSGELHPISYGSTILADNQRNWSAHQRELFSLLYFCEKYQSYLLGAQFDVITDNTTLLHLDKLKDIKSQRLWRWFEKLQKYDYKITYSPSKKNPSDALSRFPRHDDELIDTIPHNCEAVAAVTSTDIAQVIRPAAVMTDQTLCEAQGSDSDIITVRLWISSGGKPSKSSNLPPSLLTFYHSYDRLRVENDILYREWQPTRKGESSKWLICVPYELQKKVIELCHDIPTSGHLGLVKTLHRIRSRFYFPKMYTLTKLHVGKCHVCHKKSRPNKTTKAPLTPYAGKEPGHIVHIDLMEALPKAGGYHAILIVIDSFTKWCEAIPLRDTKAETVARAILNVWCSRQSIMCQIHSDRGGNVDTAKIIKEVIKLLNVTKTHNCSYRPQTNAQAERVIGTIKNMLWKFCQENPKKWITLLDQVMFAYRTAVHSGTGYSPFFLDKGRLPRLPLDIVMGTKPDNLLGENYSEAAYHLYHNLRDVYKFVNENIGVQQEYNKRRYDEKVSVKAYQIGQWVYVWKPTPAYCSYRKFYDNYRGPFKIVEKVTEHTYKIDLGPDKYDVVHMEHLKLAEEPTSEIDVSLEGYYGDLRVDESGSVIDDPSHQEDDHSSVTGSEYYSDDEIGATPIIKQKQRRPQLIGVPTGNNTQDMSSLRRSTRDRRQHTPYQHIP